MLTDFCVYTIKHSDDLRESSKSGDHDTYTEKKKWTWAKKLLDSAKRTGHRLPIIFAPAENTSYLFAWALIDAITPSDKSTSYTFSQLRLFTKPQRKTTLRMARNGRPLSKGFIRPYSICHTPKFLVR